MLEEKCQVCFKDRSGIFCTCKCCGWCDDPAQREHPDLKDMENKMSLNEARKAYKEGRPIE